MALVVVYHHGDCEQHQTTLEGEDVPHQECALRVTSVISGLRSWAQPRSVVFESQFSRASEEQLLRVHSARYLQTLRDAAANAAATGEPRPLTPPPGGATRVSGRSFVAASRAAGAACAAVDRLLSDGPRLVCFCAVRPSWHAWWPRLASGRARLQPSQLRRDCSRACTRYIASRANCDRRF